jgi:hypothetical protein
MSEAKTKRVHIHWSDDEARGFARALVAVERAVDDHISQREWVSRAQDLAVERGWLAEHRRRPLYNPSATLLSYASELEAERAKPPEPAAESAAHLVDFGPESQHQVAGDVAPHDFGPRGQPPAEGQAAGAAVHLGGAATPDGLAATLVALLGRADVRSALADALAAAGLALAPAKPAAKPAAPEELTADDLKRGPLDGKVIAAAMRRDPRPFVSRDGSVKQKPKVVIVGLKPNQAQEIKTDFGGAAEILCLEAGTSHDRVFQHSCSADLVIGMTGWTNSNTLQKAAAGAKRGNDRYRVCPGTVSALKNVLTANLAELSTQRRSLS